MPARLTKSAVQSRKKDSPQGNGGHKKGLERKNDHEGLKDIQLFKSLSKEELLTILPKVVFRDFQKNQAIIREQQPNEFMYIIIRGKVKIFQIKLIGVCQKLARACSRDAQDLVVNPMRKSRQATESEGEAFRDCLHPAGV